MNDQLDRIERLLQEHIRSSSAWREATDRRIDENTEITQGIRDRKTFWRLLREWVQARTWVVQTIGYVAGTAAAVAGLWFTIKGGKAP